MPIDTARPVLFQGEAIRAFLAMRSASRKRPCPPGTLYCFRCRQPRKPALGMVDYAPVTTASGNLGAICEQCGAMMHRRAREADLPRIMPGCPVQFTLPPPRLSGRTTASLNCDSERHG